MLKKIISNIDEIRAPKAVDHRRLLYVQHKDKISGRVSANRRKAQGGAVAIQSNTLLETCQKQSKRSEKSWPYILRQSQSADQLPQMFRTLLGYISGGKVKVKCIKIKGKAEGIKTGR